MSDKETQVGKAYEHLRVVLGGDARAVEALNVISDNHAKDRSSKMRKKDKKALRKLHKALFRFHMDNSGGNYSTLYGQVYDMEDTWDRAGCKVPVKPKKDALAEFASKQKPLEPDEAEALDRALWSGKSARKNPANLGEEQ